MQKRLKLILVLLISLETCLADLAKPDTISMACLQQPHIIDLIFSQKSPDNKLTSNIGYRKLDLGIENQGKATEKKSYMYIYEDYAPNKIVLSDELFDHYSLDYGPPTTGYWIKTPWSLLKKCKGVKSISELISLYASHYYKKMYLSLLQVEKFQALVRTPELNNAWYDYEYFTVPHNQVEYEVGRVLRSIIDFNMPQRMIDTIVIRIKECKYKANIFRFSSPHKIMKNMYSQSFKILLISCQDPKNIQVLAFNTKKSGFYINPDTTRTEKALIKKVIEVWLQTYFINMFSTPSAGMSN